MPNKKPTSLSEVVKLYASEGANDSKWILVEHQLAQAKMSIQIAKETLYDIVSSPENDNEQEIAGDCESIVRHTYLDFLAQYTTFLSYLSGTDVSDKISRKEL